MRHLRVTTGRRKTWATTLAAPREEHGIFVDANDNVWITGNGDIVLKFSKAGKFLLRIGEKFRTGGSNDPKLLGNPTDAVVDVAAREV